MAAPTSRLTQNTLTSQASDTVHRLKEAVCQIDTNHPGTGFLITPNCILTCCHVLPEREIAQNAYACFSDIQEATSLVLNPDPLKNGFYHTSNLQHEDGKIGFTAKHLDFAIVSLSQTVGKISDLFVLTDRFPPQKEQIHVIQHPVIEVTKRDPDTKRPLTIKQLTGEMRIATGQITEFDQYTVHHSAPVAGGSSGAPIVNDAGHLYAFHQAECTNPAHKKCSNPEHSRSKNPVHKDCEIQVNCGIGVRTDAVFRYLRDHHIELDNFEELRQCSALKAKYAKHDHLELIRPVRGYKDWMLKLPIDAIYTELVILQAHTKKKNGQNRNDSSFRPDQGLESYETLFMDKESISRDKFFTILKNSKKLLVLGAAGTGKTTFCQHLAFQWSTGSLLTEYQALFWIQLRHLKENETPEMLFQRAFGFTPSDKCIRCTLLILDGFDELPPYAEALFREVTTRFQHVIVTSRPKTCIPFRSAIQLEIIGLDKTNSNTYIEHYFSALHSQYPEELVEEDVMPKTHRLQTLLLNHPLLASLAHIPVNLSLLCAIFSQEEDFLTNQQPITVTALYDYIVNWLYTYFQIRQKELLTSTPDSTSDLVSQSNPLSDPAVRNLDRILRGIALNYTQNNTLYTSQAKLENLLINQNNALKINQLNDSGLFKIERGEGEFIHLSYQDFFVARHLADLYATKQCKEAQAFVKVYKLQERYKWIFWMTAGLLSINYPEILPQYFDDLHTLAPDLGKSYELKLLARCYEECLHPEVLPKYSKFLEAVANYLKEHPSLKSKAELFRDCSKLLTQSAIIQSICDFSFEQLSMLTDKINERQQYIPDEILETLCNKSKQGQWNENFNTLLILNTVIKSNRVLSKVCLEFILSFLDHSYFITDDTDIDFISDDTDTDTDDTDIYDWLENDSFAFEIFTEIFKHQTIKLSSLNAALAWLKNIILTPEFYFCLFVEGLKEHYKDQKNRASFIDTYFIQHSIGELLGLGVSTPKEMFYKLLTSNSNYSYKVDCYILELITSMLWIESISSTLSITSLVEFTLSGNQKAAHVLKELIRIDCSINDANLTKLIEQFKKEAANKNKLQNSLAKFLSEVVISEHSLSVDILTLLGKHHCIKALVNIAQAQKKYSEKAFQLILQDLEDYIADFYVNPPLLKNLLKAPYIERIGDALLNIFYTYQSANPTTLPYLSTDIAALALSCLTSTGYFFSLEAIDRFIQFLREDRVLGRDHKEDNAKWRIVITLCNMIKMGHPNLHAILKKIERELLDKEFHYNLKFYIAFIMTHVNEPTQQLSLNVIEALVSCMPNSKLKILTSSLCEIEIAEINEVGKLNSILPFILKQPSTRLSHMSLDNFLRTLDRKNSNKDIRALDDIQALNEIQAIINIFSALNYQDYSHSPWSRELFIQIAYLTGQPFIEVE